MQHPLPEQIVYGDIHCHVQIAVLQFPDFHVRVVGTFLQKVLGVSGKTDDDLFDMRILIVRKERARLDSLAENLDDVRVFVKAFAQNLCGLDSPEL